MERATYGETCPASDAWLAMKHCAARGRERKLRGLSSLGNKGRWCSSMRPAPAWSCHRAGLVDAQDLGPFTAWEPTAIFKVPTKKAVGRRTMMKGLIIVLLALGVASAARAQQPV